MPDTNHDACEPAVLNSSTYMNCKALRDIADDDIDVVISGIPFDQTTTGRSGARFGSVKHS